MNPSNAPEILGAPLKKMKASRVPIPTPRNGRLTSSIGLAILGPLILAADLLLLLGCEVVGDVEGLPDFLGDLPLIIFATVLQPTSRRA